MLQEYSYHVPGPPGLEVESELMCSHICLSWAYTNLVLGWGPGATMMDGPCPWEPKVAKDSGTRCLGHDKC